MAVEETTRNPLRDLVRHTIVYGSGYLTMAVATFVLVPVYTHHLLPSAYGLLGLMLVLYGLMSQVYDFGITNSVGRFFFDSAGSGRESDLLQMRVTAVTFLAVFEGALTLLLWVLAPQWSRLLTQSSAHADLVRIIAVTLYAEGLAIVPLVLIRMQERSHLFVAITIARFCVTLGLSMLFVVTFGWGVRGALLANAASAVGVLLILLPDYRFLTRSRPSLPLLREMLVFGVPFFPVLVSSWFIEASDRYLLGLFRTHAEVGWYVLGYKVAQVMQIAVAAFSMGWAPLRYRIFERSDAPDVYRRLTSFYVIPAGILTVGLALFAREIVTLISPPSYAPASRIVPLIAFSYALNGLYILMVTGMGVAKKTAAMAWVVTVAAVANVALNLVVIRAWGMEGAAVTTVLANVIMVGGTWYYSHRVYPIPYDWSLILRTIGLGTVVVVVALVATPGRGVAGAGFALVAWLVFVVALFKICGVSAGDLAHVRELVRRGPRESPTQAGGRLAS
jgi:O-antigen/teichoic acid export membrane protein